MLPRDVRAAKMAEKALTDDNSDVRAAAARAIAKRNATQLYDNVAMLLDDRRDEVEFSAAAAVIRLKQPAVRPVTRKSRGLALK